PPDSQHAAPLMSISGPLRGSLSSRRPCPPHPPQPRPTHQAPLLSQMGRAVFGDGPVHVVLQIATAAILTLAANTAYADFPRLSSIIARDGFLPRQFANRGDRLVFSNGVVFLAVAARPLLVAFGVLTPALLPLHA